MGGENRVENKPLGGADCSLLVRRQDAPLESVAGQIGNMYTEAFPPSQRVDFDTLIAAVKMGERRLFTAEAEGEVLGFAVTVPLPDTGIHCLEYFAVKRGQRGRGTGSILLRIVLGDLAATENALGLILEVESDHSGSEAERETRRARIAFYHRNGAHLVDGVPCFMAPDLVDGGTLEMKLMWLPAGNGPSRLCGPRLLTCLRGIYSQSYGLPLDDPRIESTLRSVS
jgi:GNAT superfamily N-acetyltransferase